MTPASTPRASLERKVPLLIGGLLLGVVALNAALSYGVVKNAALTIGRDRLRTVTTGLAASLSASVARSDSSMRNLVTDTAITRYLRNPDRGSPPTALTTLARGRGGRGSNLVVGVELLDGRRQFLYGTSPRTRGSSYDLAVDLAEAAASPARVRVGRIRPDGDTLVFPIVAAVPGASQPAGYLVAWSKIASAPEARGPLLELLGTGAQLYLGNDSVWTDLAERVAPPVPRASNDTSVLQYARPMATDKFVRGQPASTRVLGTARPIAGTPWTVLVEFPESAVFASVDSYVRRASVIGIIVILFGLILAWRLSRSITEPIARLTEASAAIARGDFRQVADASRPDELGSLGAAFNSMALQVRDTQVALEERVKERTRKLEERNEELEAFAYTVAHDLRAPIRAMHGFSDALLEDFGDVLGYRGRDYAKRVVDAARRMDALVRDLLEYSQIVRGDVVLAPVELSGVVRNVIANEEEEIRLSGADVAVDGALPTVLGHQAILSQAVLNLVGNALKFVPPGKTPRVRISAEQRDAWTRLWVADNGLGIPPEQQDMIFRVFERLHRREDYPGTGIGLAIVRKGLERMGGRSGVESTPGTGSRFWIELQTVGTNAA
jgi:signal transduction histidine kinase